MYAVATSVNNVWIVWIELSWKLMPNVRYALVKTSWGPPKQVLEPNASVIFDSNTLTPEGSVMRRRGASSV